MATFQLFFQSGRAKDLSAPLITGGKKSRVKLRNACYHSVQNLLSSRLLSNKFKIKIHRNTTLPVVLYVSQALSFTKREERRLRVYENMALNRIFGPKRDKVTGQ